MKKASKNRLLIIDDEDNMLHMLSASMKREGYEVVTASNGQQGIDYALEQSFDCILCDLKMPQMDGLTVLERVKELNINTTIIMMSAFATVDTAVKAMKNGAYDFVTKPFKIDEILCILDKAAEREKLKKENSLLRQKVEVMENEKSLRSIIGESKCIKDLIHLVGRAAKYDTTILVTGESGTGKELFAKQIQAKSVRADKPFISVNCGAIPENLLESEFFGYVKGAFTGAEKDHKGLFESADGGTLFLDEIGELSLEMQVKLLRVLQEQEIRPVGSNITRKINVRIVAATAKNLQKAVASGTFRNDLFFRLNVVALHIPPLKERKDDILLLCNSFINKFNTQFEKNVRNISPEAFNTLQKYDWPGNVRELQNVIEHSVIFANEEEILLEHLPGKFRDSIESSSVESLSGTHSLKHGKRLMEKMLIEKALATTDGNKSKAALLLEISYPSLLGKIKDYNLSQP